MGVVQSKVDYAVVAGVFAAMGTLLLQVGKSREEWWGLEARRAKQLELAKMRLELWEKRSGQEAALLSGAALEEAKRESYRGQREVWRETNENLRRMSVPDTTVQDARWSSWRRWFLFYKPAGSDRWLGYFLRGAFLVVFGLVLWNAGLLMWGLFDLIRYKPQGRSAILFYQSLAGGLVSYFLLLLLGAQIRKMALWEDQPRKLNDLRAI